MVYVNTTLKFPLPLTTLRRYSTPEQAHTNHNNPIRHGASTSLPPQQMLTQYSTSDPEQSSQSKHHQHEFISQIPIAISYVSSRLPRLTTKSLTHHIIYLFLSLSFSSYSSPHQNTPLPLPTSRTTKTRQDKTNRISFLFVRHALCPIPHSTNHPSTHPSIPFHPDPTTQRLRQ